MFIRKLIKFLKVRQKTKQFQRNAVFGKDCFFDETSGCSNTTGRKDSIKIGESCAVRGHVYAMGQGKVEIGAHTYIGSQTHITAVESIKIGKCAIISNFVRVVDCNSHPTDPQERLEMSMSGFFNENWDCTRSASKPIVIEDNVWLGEFSTVLKGVTVGKGSIVASHAMVTKDVPAYSVVAGNPAKIVKQLNPLQNDVTKGDRKKE